MYCSDHKSLNGTFLNETKVNGKRRLHHGDVLNFGKCKLVRIKDLLLGQIKFTFLDGEDENLLNKNFYGRKVGNPHVKGLRESADYENSFVDRTVSPPRDRRR